MEGLFAEMPDSDWNKAVEKICEVLSDKGFIVNPEDVLAREPFDLTDEEAEFYIRMMCKELGIKLIWKNTKAWSGQAYKEKIWIAKDLSPKDKIETFFHEFMHVECYRNKKFFEYHNSKVYVRSAKQLKSKVAQAWRAERYVDFAAEKLCKEVFPTFEWRGAYREKYDYEFLTRYLDNDYKRWKNRRKRRKSKCLES